MDFLQAANSASTKASLQNNLQPFLNFSGLPFNTSDPVYNLFPSGCKLLERQKARTVIAYSGNTDITDKVARDIMLIRK